MEKGRPDPCGVASGNRPRLRDVGLGGASKLAREALEHLAGSFRNAVQAMQEFSAACATMADRMVSSGLAQALQEQELKEAWDEAIATMEPAISDLKAEGFCKNVQMKRVYEQDAFGKSVCIGYEISAFNGVTTKTTYVLFPTKGETS